MNRPIVYLAALAGSMTLSSCETAKPISIAHRHVQHEGVLVTWSIAPVKGKGQVQLLSEAGKVLEKANVDLSAGHAWLPDPRAGRFQVRLVIEGPRTETLPGGLLTVEKPIKEIRFPTKTDLGVTPIGLRTAVLVCDARGGAKDAALEDEVGTVGRVLIEAYLGSSVSVTAAQDVYKLTNLRRELLSSEFELPRALVAKSLLVLELLPAHESTAPRLAIRLYDVANLGSSTARICHERPLIYEDYAKVADLDQTERRAIRLQKTLMELLGGLANDVKVRKYLTLLKENNDQKLAEDGSKLLHTLLGSEAPRATDESKVYELVESTLLFPSALDAGHGTPVESSVRKPKTVPVPPKTTTPSSAKPPSRKTPVKTIVPADKSKPSSKAANKGKN